LKSHLNDSISSAKDYRVKSNKNMPFTYLRVDMNHSWKEKCKRFSGSGGTDLKEAHRLKTIVLKMNANKQNDQAALTPTMLRPFSAIGHP